MVIIQQLRVRTENYFDKSAPTLFKKHTMIAYGNTNYIIASNIKRARQLTSFLGHKAYEPGTETFRKVVAHFGEHIVAEDGTINRRVLGGIVFGDQVKMKELT